MREKLGLKIDGGEAITACLLLLAGESEMVTAEEDPTRFGQEREKTESDSGRKAPSGRQWKTGR